MRLRLRLLVACTALATAGTPSVALAEDAFCRGYQVGYKRGYCANHGGQFCIAPIAPICPLAGIGESGFQDGYDRGYADGLEAS